MSAKPMTARVRKSILARVTAGDSIDDIAYKFGLYNSEVIAVAASRKPFVFSIRGQYVRAILAGRKRWEFRTRRPSLLEGERWLIYETSPKCRIVASVRTTRIVLDTPEFIWRNTYFRVGVSRAEFDAYFKGRAVAVAIGFKDVQTLDLALPEGMRAPQSWARWTGPWPVAGVQ